MYYQIAIDGPAGAGKSTIAKIVAERLGYIYIDTGAMYRAIGLFFEKNNGYEDETCIDRAKIELAYKDGAQRIFLNGEDVSEAIRTESAGMNASRVSALPRVRTRLVELQQDLAGSSNIVMDGRDIGTVVLPDATLKIFLTASVSVRALRRLRQLQRKGVEADIKKIEEDIRQRDHNDYTRAVSPLKQAEDAVFMDTSDMTIEETVTRIIELLRNVSEK